MPAQSPSKPDPIPAELVEIRKIVERTQRHVEWIMLKVGTSDPGHHPWEGRRE